MRVAQASLTFGLQGLRAGGRAIGIVPGNRDFGSHSAESAADGFANATISSGDQGYFPIKPE